MDNGIEYRSRPPDKRAYSTLYESTGWNQMYAADRDELGLTLKRSWHVVCAYRDRELVGSGRLVSDGVLYAVVFDMVVAPEERGRGIGTEILRRLLARCREAGIRDVLLFAARGTEPFYRRHGFERRSDDAPGMILRRVTERT